MPEDVKTTYSRREGKYVPSHTGTQAGKSFPSSAEVSENADWQKYKVEKKLSFAAQKKQYEADFREWRKRQATKSGQASALKETETAKKPEGE